MENVEQILADYLDKTHLELFIRSYSPKTVKAYTLSLKEYFKFFSSFLPQNYIFFGLDKNLDEDLIKRFLRYKKEQDCAPKTLHVYLSAIKFFYQEVLRTPLKIDIKYAKRPRRLPTVLAHDEIMAIIRTLGNLKHRLMIALAYGAGLRVSEVTNLKISHLNFDNKTILIQQSKNAKDRMTLLPQPLAQDLMEFIRSRPGTDYLFKSQRGGKLSTRTLQKIFKHTIKKAGIAKQASFHSLRHSFASHLVNANVNLRVIQELLGHQSIKTTQIYTHIAPETLRNIQSPL